MKILAIADDGMRTEREDPRSHRPNMKIVNRRRNIEAGHSAVGDFEPKTVSEVRSQLKLELVKIGDELQHMLTHIADIEQRM